MPEYINQNAYTVYLLSPEGKQIAVRSHQKIILSDYFDRYVTRGLIKKTAPAIPQAKIRSNIESKINLTTRKPAQINQIKPIPRVEKPPARRDLISKAKKISDKSSQRKHVIPDKRGRRLIVGRKLQEDATSTLNNNLNNNIYPISNGIGIGILSYNRKQSLQRLVDSIRNNTDLRKTTVFISDDNSTDQAILEYLDQLSKTTNFVVIRNDENLGVAGNSNRLLRCLARFKYGLILNDDVEVLRPGWDYFYSEATEATGIQHFQHREQGIYGAELGQLLDMKDFHIRRVDEKPHGAVLSFTSKMLDVCGFFDESYGKYGMEHVDWSMKPSEFGLQNDGFYDVEGSDSYFKLHSDKTSVDKGQYLQQARDKFRNRRVRFKVEPSLKSALPDITYVVPFRNIDRKESITTVINNIRAQRFPVIDIIAVEQDSSTKINVEDISPVSYYLVPSKTSALFNKSKAFNYGVSKAASDKIILHDADMLILADYTSHIAKTLDSADGCHLGGTVIYTSREAMDAINTSGVVEHNANCERLVGYYEGGSLACRKSTYWKVGGFNEDFWGYGCFLPGNKVITNRGLVNIEEVEKCDKLLTHTGHYRKQEARIRNYHGTVLDIYVPGRLPIKGVTPEHPFLVHDTNNEYVWREARDLRKGDLLAQTDLIPDMSPTVRFEDVIDANKSKNRFNIDINIEYEFELINDIKEYQYDGLVYNFEVEEDHSYYVHGMSVHNCEDCDFYARLSRHAIWKEDRVHDLLHLWHGRTDGWNDHHQENKRLEQRLLSLDVIQRIEKQRNQLRQIGYGEFL